MNDINAIPMLACLDARQRAEIFGIMEPLRAAPNQRIFKHNDPAEEMFIIDSGLVQIFLPDPVNGTTDDGKTGQVLARLGRYEVFGEFALLTPGLRTASAVALEETWLYRIRRRDFENLASAAEPIRRVLIEQLVNRISVTNQNYQDAETTRKAVLDELARSWTEKKRRLAAVLSAGPSLPVDVILRHASVSAQEVKDFMSENSRLFESSDGGEVSSAAVWRACLLTRAGQTDPSLVAAVRAGLENWYERTGRLEDRVELAVMHGDWAGAFGVYAGWLASLPLRPKAEIGPSGGPDRARRQRIETLLNACPRSQVPRNHEVILPCLRGCSDPFLVSRLIEETALVWPPSWPAERTAEYLDLAETWYRTAGRPDRAADFSRRRQAWTKPLRSEPPFKRFRRRFKTDAGRKALAVFLGLACCLIVAGLPFAAAVPAKDIRLLAIVSGGMVVLGFSVFPMFLVLMAVCALLVLAGCADISRLAVGYANPAWLFFACILMYSAAVAKSGLLYRLSLRLIQRFPAGYGGQVIGLFMGGFLITLVVPSGMIRVALASMLTANILTTLGLEENSRAGAGLRFAAYLGFVGFGPYLLTGYATNGALFAMASPGGSVGWLEWLKWSAPALLLYALVFAAAVTAGFRPRQAGTLTKKTTLEGQLALLGRISRAEKITAAATVGYIVLILLQPVHHADISLITVMLAVSLFVFGVLNTQDILKQVDWSLLLFLGGIFSVSRIVRDSSLPDILQQGITAALRTNDLPPAAVLLAAYLVLALGSRFIVADVLKYSLLIILPGIAGSLGIHPWIVVFTILLATDNLFPYLNISYYIGIYGQGDPAESGSAHRRMRPLRILYFGLTLAFPLLLYPWWRFMGLLP